MIEIQDTFDMQTNIADELVKNEDFLNKLKIQNFDNKNDELSQKVNLQEMKMELFNAAQMPLISIYFPDATSSRNYLVNNALLRIESYTTNRKQAKELIRTIKEVLRNKFDMRVIAEGEQPCDIANVYKYRLEYIPLIWS